MYRHEFDLGRRLLSVVVTRHVLVLHESERVQKILQVLAGVGRGQIGELTHVAPPVRTVDALMFQVVLVARAGQDLEQEPGHRSFQGPRVALFSRHRRRRRFLQFP